MHEVKCGFIPGSQDAVASRLRRRYRFIKGGHPQLVLVHYTRGPQTPIPPLANQPVRSYPLRMITEPPVFVMGEKAGQKVFPQGGPMHGTPPAGQQITPGGGMGMGMPFNPQAMVARQNSNMEMLERRRERERAHEQAGNVNRARMDDDESADETEHISTRTLAMARYRRNHELMNAVFMHAAFGEKSAPAPPKPYSIFDQSQLDTKLAKLQSEISLLHEKAAERDAARTRANTKLHGDDTTFSLANSKDVMAVS
ncbi:hypothetical protein AX17_005305 [Amanita inopinata Kibby_2008]|nr:hypothetical protein AX17_005305 [Amanita inopinata Kibby_2008]